MGRATDPHVFQGKGGKMSSLGPRLSLTGKATVHCVHDRIKREVVTEEQVVALGAEAGVVLNKAHHKIHRCPCCDNLFVADGSDARYCHGCKGVPVHPLGGPLAEPKGVVA